MNLLRYRDYEGTAEVDTDRNICHGRILFIDDLVTYEAPTPAKLKREFEAAVDDYIETCAEIGKEPQRPFKGSFNVRVPPALHRAAAGRALQDGVSLNELVVRALTSHLDATLQVNYNVTPPLIAQFIKQETGRATASAPHPLYWEQPNVH